MQAKLEVSFPRCKDTIAGILNVSQSFSAKYRVFVDGVWWGTSGPNQSSLFRIRNSCQKSGVASVLHRTNAKPIGSPTREAYDEILVSGVAEAGNHREQFVRRDIPASMLDFVIVDRFRKLFPGR